MRRRGCLISFGALAALVLVCCLVVWFVALPRVQDSIADDIQEGISTEIAEQIDRTGVELDPGTHTISVTELEQQLQDASGVQNVDDIAFFTEDGRITLRLRSMDQNLLYSGVPVAENGEFALTDVETNADGGFFFDQIFPADTLTGAVEGGVNSYFEAQGLEIVSVTAQDGELIFETVDSGQ